MSANLLKRKRYPFIGRLHQGRVSRSTSLHVIAANSYCPQCNRQFLSNNHLRIHMRIHTGERPYKCQHCGRSFNQSGSYKRHLVSIHGDMFQ